MLVLAASTSQARVVFEYCRGFFDASPVLRREVVSTTANEIRLDSGVVIAVHPNSYRTVRGKTLLACIFDEVAIWRDAESALPDIETYRAVLPSLVTTNGMLIGISSPYRKTGLLYQKHRDHFGQPGDDVLVIQGPSRAFNPTLDEEVIAAASAPPTPRPRSPSGAASSAPTSRASSTKRRSRPRSTAAARPSCPRAAAFAIRRSSIRRAAGTTLSRSASATGSATASSAT